MGIEEKVLVTTKEIIHKQYFPILEDDLDRYIAVRKASGTKRFHTWPTIQSQRIDTHSHGAVVIALYLDPLLGVSAIKAILFHDHAEYFCGDVPATAKVLNPSIRTELKSVEVFADTYMGIDFELTEYEQLILKLADCLEGLMFLYEERMLGNRNADPAFRNYLYLVREVQCQVNNSAVLRAVALAKRMMFKFCYEAGGSLDVKDNFFEV